MTTEDSELLEPIKQYNTFPHNDIINTSINSTVFFYLFISTLITIAINTSAFFIGVTYNNNTCYNEQKIMSLSSWLIICSACFLVYQIAILFVTLTFYCRSIIPNYKEFYICSISIIILMKVALIILKLIMFIIGIIELVHQYPSCHEQVHPVTSITIVIIVINAIYYVKLL